MPVYSGQIGSMMAQQNQMFAGYSSYAAGFSPGGPPGMEWGPRPTFESMPYTAGMSAMSAAHSILPAAIGMGTLAGGMLLPGALGRAVGNLDPFQAALGGFGRASGITRGIAGQGIMDSIGTMGANLGRIGAGGFGNVVRAGIIGLGGAAMAAALPIAAGAAISYAGGQMIEGAQYAQQVQRSLGQNFRFLNNQSTTGFGFSREQGKDIADTLREMGSKDIMSSPGEMLRLMEQGVQGGMFRAVQDAKAFKEKFKEMTKGLREIAKTFNTTMEGAMPFLTEARRMGFWTPSDVMRLASPTQAAAINSGQSVAQVQAMQQQGAAMARQVGAAGTAGAAGITNVINMVGGAIRSGAISERQLSDMTGGLQGSAAIDAYAGQLQASSTRFAASRQARWLLAAAANKDMTGLDAGKLSLLTSGRMGADQIRGMAERGRQGRDMDFVMGEEEMRGDMLKMGVEGQAGFLKGLVGKQLYGDTGMDKLATRKLIQRFMGGDAKQADAMAQIMRNLPQIKRDNMRRSEAEADQVAREQDRIMGDSYEGLKRRISKWWEDTVDEPNKQTSSYIAKGIGDAWERWTDRLWSRTPRGMRSQGVTAGMLRASQAAALGDSRAYNATFASGKEMASFTATSVKGEQVGTVNADGRVSMPNWGGSLSHNEAREMLGGLTQEGNKLFRYDNKTAAENMLKRHEGTAAGLASALGKAGETNRHGGKYGGTDITDLYRGPQAEAIKAALVQARTDLPGAKAALAKAAAATPDADQAALLRSLSRGGGDVDKTLQLEGQSIRERNTSDISEVTKRRMGKVDIKALASLDDFKDANKKSLGLGTTLTKIVKEGMDSGDAQAVNNQLAEVAKTLANMGDSPEARAKVGAVIEQLEKAGFGMASAALGTGAADIMDVKNAWGPHGSLGAKANSLSNTAGALGLTTGGKSMFSPDVIKGLMARGGKEYAGATEKLRSLEEGMSPENKALAEKLAKAVHETDMGTIVGMARAGGKLAGISALANAQTRERIDANMVGKTGTLEGVHKQLSLQTSIQKQILQKIPGVTPDADVGNKKITDNAHEDDTTMTSHI